MKNTPLLNKIGNSSIPHQLSLLKEIDLESHVQGKELVDWYCYICGNICNVWNVYIAHVEGRKHKMMFSRLHEIGYANLKEILIRNLAQLPKKGLGDPNKSGQLRLPHVTTPHVKSTPLDEREQAFFCGQCFRTYAVSYEEHLESEIHKKYKKIRQKCTLCSLTFLDQRSYQRHIEAPSHIMKLQVGSQDKDKNKEDDDDDDVVIVEVSKPSSTEKKQPTDTSSHIFGPEFIIPITGFYCKLCSKFYNKENTAKEVHCSTGRHAQRVKEYYATCNKSPEASHKAVNPETSSKGVKPLAAPQKESVVGTPKKDATVMEKDIKLIRDVKKKQGSISQAKLVLSIPKMTSSKIEILKSVPRAIKQVTVPETKPSSTKRETSPSPAKRETSPSPAKQETLPSPAKRETSPSPAKQETPPAPAKRETPPSPSKQETPPSPSKRETSPSPAKRETPPAPAKRETTPPSDAQEIGLKETGSDLGDDDMSEMDWIGEMPDFENMISIDEVGESDEEEEGSIKEGEWDVSEAEDI